jgi:hypothetical protein
MSDYRDQLSRRTFLASAGASALAAAAFPTSAHSIEKVSDMQASSQHLITGNGEWTYQVASGWGTLPADVTFGGTHGAIAQDKAGNIYVSTQSSTGILVYSPEGRLLNRIAGDFPEVHSMVHAEEDGIEFFYTTVQKGTDKENWLFVKMKTDGTPVLKITAPPEAGFKSPNEWRITAAVPAPDGSIFIANGYGDSRIFHFDRNGHFLRSYSGKGSDPGLLNCSHGLTLDTRYDQPLLLVCDRENRRLCHFDLDGKYVATVTQHLRRPCQITLHGDYAIVSELEGRVTILDRDNMPVAFLGDNPNKSEWANYDLDPKKISPVVFSAAHGCYIDRQANIYVSDWNHTGRVNRLARYRG